MLRFWIIAAVCSGIGYVLYQNSIGLATPLAALGGRVKARAAADARVCLRAQHQRPEAGSGAVDVEAVGAPALPAPRDSTQVLVADAGAGQRVLGHEPLPGSRATTCWRTVPPLRSFTRTSVPVGELASRRSPSAIRSSQSRQRSGLTHRAQTALAGACALRVRPRTSRSGSSASARWAAASRRRRRTRSASRSRRRPRCRRRPPHRAELLRSRPVRLVAHAAVPGIARRAPARPRRLAARLDRAGDHQHDHVAGDDPDDR